jgi:DNA-binding GntR family transcriptional regulator
MTLEETATRRAYAFMKDAITSRTIQEGDFLIPEDIGRRLGISRTPVREAVALLQAENLVDLVPHKGAYVRPVSDREASEIFEARLLLELHGCERLVLDPTPAVQRQRELITEQQRLADEDDVAAFIARDREFHEILVGATTNRMLIRFYENLRDQQMRIGIQLVSYSHQRIAAVLDEHRAIVDALESRDLDRVHRALTDHLANSRQALRAVGI